MARLISAHTLTSVSTNASRVSMMPPPTPVPPTPTPANPADDPNARIVLDMVAKLNAGDVDGSLAYFSEEAMSYFMGLPPTGIEYYRGGEGLRPMWEYCVSDNFEWKVEITQVDRNIVYAKAQTWLDFTRQLRPAKVSEVTGRCVALGAAVRVRVAVRVMVAVRVGAVVRVGAGVRVGVGPGARTEQPASARAVKTVSKARKGARNMRGSSIVPPREVDQRSNSLVDQTCLGL